MLKLLSRLKAFSSNIAMEAEEVDDVLETWAFLGLDQMQICNSMI